MSEMNYVAIVLIALWLTPGKLGACQWRGGGLKPLQFVVCGRNKRGVSLALIGHKTARLPRIEMVFFQSCVSAHFLHSS